MDYCFEHEDETIICKRILKRMKILDIEKSISDYETGTDTSIGQATYIDLKKQLEKIKNIVGNEIN